MCSSYCLSPARGAWTHLSAALRERVVSEPAWDHLWGVPAEADPSGRKAGDQQERSEQKGSARVSKDREAAAAAALV